MPRHPPCALHSLSHTHTNTTQQHPTTTPNSGKRQSRPTIDTHTEHGVTQRTTNTLAQPDLRRQPPHRATGLRCSRPLSNKPNNPTQTPTPAHPPMHTPDAGGLIPQAPTVCQHPPSSTTDHQVPPPDPTPASSSSASSTERQPDPRERGHIVDDSTSEHPSAAGTNVLTRVSGCVLLRKEVIQPHLPVRLPCYDFVPIASPTFDHSLRKRLGHGLRVLPTFVT